MDLTSDSDEDDDHPIHGTIVVHEQHMLSTDEADGNKKWEPDPNFQAQTKDY